MNHLFNLIVLVGLLTGVALANLGHIQIEINSALLNSTNNNNQTYVKVCVQNSTHFNPTPLQSRTGCVNCASSLAPRGNKPVWNAICEGTTNAVFSDQAQIIFEVFAHQQGKFIRDSSMITVKDTFLGSSNLTIKHLLNYGQNRIELTMPLQRISLKNYGSLNSTVSWTPLQ